MFDLALPLIQIYVALLLYKIATYLTSTRSVIQSKSREFFDRYLDTKFSNAGYKYEIDSIWRIIIGALLVSAVFGFIITPYLALLFPVICLVVGFFFLRSRADSVAGKTSRVNDEICFYIGRSLRSGQTLENSILSASKEFPFSSVVSEIGKHLRAGLSLVGTIDHVARQSNKRLNSTEKTLCATISLAQQMGGNSARVFERIGDIFHQRYELVNDTAAALAQVKLSVYVITMLPVVMFGFSLLLGSEAAFFLFTNPVGVVCLVLGIALETMGIIWMKRLVDKGVKTWSL